MPREDDRRLGQTAVRLGMLTAEQLDECLRAQEQAWDEGGAAPLLGKMLVDRGHLDSAGLDRLLAAHAKELEARPRLSRYEVLEPLGEGAFSTVYRARDPQLGREVAVKVLRRSIAANPRVRERFRREARVAASIAHPNVVAVHDAGESHEDLYLVMEHVSGRSLGAILAQRDRPDRDLVSLLERAARGVAAAHDAGIVHRDLKPANILVGADGEPKVTDFGLAHLAEADAGLTRSGDTLGTPLYMAPEQVGGSRHVSPRSDVFALGAILYEILGGRPPHHAEAVSEIYLKILTAEPPPLPAETPRELDAVARRALEKDPAYRYRDARELADDLARWLEGRAVKARRVPPLVRFLRRHRLAAGVVLLALAAAGAGAWAWMSHRRDVEARVAEQIRLARTLESQRHFDEAERALRDALRLDPGAEEPRAALAALLEAARLWREGREEAVRRLEIARSFLERAARGVYSESTTPAEVARLASRAEPFIREAMALGPDLPEVHYVLGSYEELRGSVEASEAAWRRALEFDAHFGPAHYRLGLSLVERAYLERLAVSPHQHPARIAAAARLLEEADRLLAAALEKSAGLDEGVERAAAEAMRLYLLGEHRKAHDAAHAGLETHQLRDGREVFWWLIGVTAGAEEAEEACTKALEIRPHYAVARLSRAISRTQRGDLPGAIQDLDFAIEVRRRFTHAYIARGSARQRLNDLDGAIADFDEALRLAPAQLESQVNRALCFFRKNEMEIAEEDLAEVIGKDPDYGAAYALRGMCAERRLDFDAAMADFDEAVRRSPGFAFGWLQRGRMQLRRGDREAAVRDFTKALECDPALPEAWLNRGLTQLGAGRKNEAAGDLRRALDLAPADWPHRANAERRLADALGE